MRPPRRLSAAVLAVVVVITAGCGDDDTAGSAPTTTPTPITDDPATDDPATDDPATDDPTTTAEPAGLAGEAIDFFFARGDVLSVVGVAADDVLHVRSGPGTDAVVVDDLDPLAADVRATGTSRQLASGAIWTEVETDGATGWASTAFLAYAGGTTDVTTELYPAADGRPSAETMLALAEIVGRDRSPPGEPVETVTVVDSPTVDAVGEVTVDVVGYPDDAVLGERLVVVAEPDPGGESFTVRTVESTLLCRRGTDGDVCV